MNIREILNQLSIPFQEHGSSPHVTQGWVGLECPFCGRGTRKYGLGIHVRTLAVSCWKCGKHRLGDTLAEASGTRLGEVLKLLPQHEADPREDERRPVGVYTPPPGVGTLQEAHRQYLIKRGLDPDEVHTTWGVQGIGDVGQYKWRLFIPVLREGKPVSWTTRAVGSRVSTRYLSAPPEAETVPLKRCLYGEHKARHAVVVVEGPVDVWAIGPGAVATFGLVVTTAQIARIARFPVRIIAFDNEEVAQRRASALADSLAVMPGETAIVRLSGKDAATSPREELDELRSCIAGTIRG